MDDSRILPFTARTGRGSGDGKQPPEDDELIEPGNAYAVVRGVKNPPALRFLGGDGRLLFAMPYSYAPIVWGQSSKLVLLEYPGFFTVILAGDDLGPLEMRLCEYRVTWIRLSVQAHAIGLPVVTRIERARVYPSREPEGDGSDN